MQGYKGFSFIELLITVSIIGILAAVAIPAFMGQKKNADLVGDAQQNSKALQMMLETRKADNGVYGSVVPMTYTWTRQSDGSLLASDATFLPLFGAKGSSNMTYSLTLNTGLTYTLTVNDNRPGKGNAMIFRTDQTGAQLYP